MGSVRLLSHPLSQLVLELRFYPTSCSRARSPADDVELVDEAQHLGEVVATVGEEPAAHLGAEPVAHEGGEVVGRLQDAHLL